MSDRTETLKHLATKGMVFDGDLISKSDRDYLFNKGYIDRYDGWNFLTSSGASLASDLGLVRP